MAKILVTGATGYIGGRLVPRLLQAGHAVCAVSRSLDKLQGRNWANHAHVTLKAVDLLHKHTLDDVMEDCEIAYYFVHSMAPESSNFADSDRQAAENFIELAEKHKLKRIIYLGGLGEPSKDLSPHLQSRMEVAKILQSSAIPVTTFRAAMIIGAGSASFEILRYLVDRLPVMITPKWVRTPCQPIFIFDALYYLLHCLEHPETIGRSFDIGGPDITNYEEMFKIYAEYAALPRRRIIRVPFLTPWLSSLWIGFVSPIPPALARPLICGLKNPVVCKENTIRDIIPQKLVGCREAIRRAIINSVASRVESSWTDAGMIPPAEWLDQQDPKWAGGTYFEDRGSIDIASNKENVWNILTNIGGKTGWYSNQWLWAIRGFIDRLVGGVGLRRGRRSLYDLKTGDALDWWRVKIVDKPNRLVLVAEMKVPGEAILEFKLDENEPKKCHLELIARFLPSGLWGIIYWYTVAPFHFFIFKGMLKEIARQQFLQRHLPFHGRAKLSFTSMFYSSIDATADILEISITGCRLKIDQSEISIPDELYVYFDDTPFAAKTYVKWQNNENNVFQVGLEFLDMSPSAKDWLYQAMK